MTQEALNHEKKIRAYIARQICVDVMKFKLKHVSVRETSIMIQPLLYWLAASPDRLITDESSTPILGLKLNALFPNVIYTHKICLKIRIFMSNYEMECHT